MSLDELKAAAVAMLDRAYCPYSHFPVAPPWNVPTARFSPAATLKTPFTP